MIKMPYGIVTSKELKVGKKALEEIEKEEEEKMLKKDIRELKQEMSDVKGKIAKAIYPGIEVVRPLDII